jgi:hypothetical protein
MKIPKDWFFIEEKLPISVILDFLVKLCKINKNVQIKLALNHISTN